MDPEPLGLPPAPIVIPQELSRWGDAPPAQHASVSVPTGAARSAHPSPFPWDDSINHKLVLW